VPRTARRTVVRVAAAALAVALAPALTGCATGFDAGTQTQRASGNGANVDLAPLQIRDVTIVQGAPGSTSGTVLMTIVNTSTQAETLTGVTVLAPPAGRVVIAGAQATGGALPLPPLSSTRVGYNSDDHVDLFGFDIAPARYAQVQLQFAKAGQVTLPVMAVAPAGIYAGITVLPAA
jgi:copper(I)-binding protein